MNITERSKQYAQGKALEAITAAIEKAYQDGYNDGLNHLELEKMEAAKTGVKYVDLGLSSGTLWSKCYLGEGEDLYSYLDASKFNIPTKEQYEELFKESKVCYLKNCYDVRIGIKFIGPNGGEIQILYKRIQDLDATNSKNQSFYFWIKDDEAGDKKNCAGIITDDQDIMETPVNKIFMGLKLPVMLVK